jgi:hypothetical protein
MVLGVMLIALFEHGGNLICAPQPIYKAVMMSSQQCGLFSFTLLYYMFKYCNIWLRTVIIYKYGDMHMIDSIGCILRSTLVVQVL